MPRPDVSLDVLRTFVAVHRSGSISAAARELGLAQPSVSAQLRALEQQVGALLVVRGSRGVRPTAAGDALAARLEGPLDTLVDVADSVGRPVVLTGGTLVVGGPAELVAMRVVPALAPLVRDGVLLRFRLGLAHDLLGDLAAGAANLVVSTVRPRVRGVVATPLGDEEFVLVAAPELVARLGADRLRAAPAETLSEAPLLAYAEDLPVVRRWWRHVLGTRPPRHAALVVPDLRALADAATAGAGVTVLPRYLCVEPLRDGRLVEVLATEDPPVNTFWLATRRDEGTSPAVAAARSLLLRAARAWG